MGDYKTLYRIKLSFSIKQCAHCQLTFRWYRRNQELMFSWPVISPFPIINVEFWIPSKYPDSNGNMVLINAMCDMSQFVVVVPVPDEYSATLVDYFFT